tara:strand:+ start:78 stop:647 length:570 start_codon:yes stop_codon:yes gene_type:complete
MRPRIAHVALYSQLITRPTGRTLRTNIVRQIADLDHAVMAVLNFRHVPLIDVSCADEIVAELVEWVSEETPHPRFVWFCGVAEHHLEPIEGVLKNRDLVAAAENTDGEPLLMGRYTTVVAQAWRGICDMGRARVPALAERIPMSLDDTSSLLDEMESLSLVIRDDDEYVSLKCAFQDTEVSYPLTLDGQ